MGRRWVGVVAVIVGVAGVPALATAEPTVGVSVAADLAATRAAAEPVVVERPVTRAVPAIQSRPWPAPDPMPRRLVLVGDSLAQETSAVLPFFTPDLVMTPKFWGGTAPCDWLDTGLEADASSIVVISFTGNSLTPCMEDVDGAHLDGAALIDRYRADLGVLVDQARGEGAQVVLVGQPLRAARFDADDEVEGINAALRDYATLPFVSFVDAGAAVEAPGGGFTERLPCEPFDVGCADDGTVVVRGDGVHFCPNPGEAPCTVWSSGAVRFAMAIADAI